MDLWRCVWTRLYIRIYVRNECLHLPTSGTQLLLQSLFKNLTIPLILSLLPFIFQLPPTKNFRLEAMFIAYKSWFEMIVASYRLVDLVKCQGHFMRRYWSNARVKTSPSQNLSTGLFDQCDSFKQWYVTSRSGSSRRFTHSVKTQVILRYPYVFL